MTRSRYNFTPQHPAPTGDNQSERRKPVRAADSSIDFIHVAVDRTEAMADADKAQRLLASLIAHRIISSVSQFSDNKEKTL